MNLQFHFISKTELNVDKFFIISLNPLKIKRNVQKPRIIFLLWGTPDIPKHVSFPLNTIAIYIIYTASNLQCIITNGEKGVVVREKENL